ncbi:TetR family transcriptional regulator [Sediminihabitans luteus]|uniref:TetR family transcriptional regulator n=1 Tax=Sediminihabitans luteus TaxID=1138585 RepID=A0A2M9CPK8_9CELL|nr:TetR/AcrR family transcriptional regulator C-terminal domain-containing protein [Sediminihabitans luteus]PJJ73827.1 TetR family transcriptional regulator [Sediminihabitans luteus]GIJ00504.1 hypothetical protein Slu03_28810 [Sediminihabitans luteus]
MAERLDRARVVRCALVLLDEVGLDGLTTRRLAAELDVKAPALFWHFRGKDDLLDEMAATMLADLADADVWDDASADWAECVRESAHVLRSEITRRRDGARLFARTFADPALGRAAIARPMRILTDAGLAADDAAAAWRTVLGFVLGFVVQEQGRPGERAASDDAAPAASDDAAHGAGAGAGAGAGPVEAEVEAEGVVSRAAEVDAQFAFGVDVLVRGLRSRLGVESADAAAAVCGEARITADEV